MQSEKSYRVTVTYVNNKGNVSTIKGLAYKAVYGRNTWIVISEKENVYRVNNHTITGSLCNGLKLRRLGETIAINFSE